ncbi:MAG TPA: tRNA (adenosine(37)-N6)-dimethylallyltransferase MiaA [Firmicutes bacterium]|nr:tRNA (adenosine(37)-N6)-dimethylallyltransferase MiaA [Bacillota bacterium]
MIKSGMDIYPFDLIIISGPTGVGKSEICEILAEQWKAEIISADSQAVYRGLDIGTAKPRTGVIPYHCIDLADPREQFDVARFVACADKAVEEIKNRKRPAIMAGGTPLYIHRFLYGLSPLPGCHRAVREELETRLQKEGAAALFNELKKCDPLTASKIHPHDHMRIIRAMEVYQVSGKPLSHWREREKKEQRYRVLYFILNRPRSVLYQRINQRVDMMMARGWTEEVRELLLQGIPTDAPALRAVGYKEILSYVSGEMTLDETADAIKKKTRHFARRQLIWFRKEQETIWIDAEEDGETVCKTIINYIKEGKDDRQRE